jgi:tol-pal system protein YbgF
MITTMFAKSPALPRTLAAAAAVAFLVSTASTGEAAGWPFTFGKQKPQPDESVQLVQADDRIGRVEQQMRTLTGQIEELTHQLQVLQDQLKKMQDDTEFRFSELQGGAGAPPAAPAASGAQQQANTAPPAPAVNTAAPTPAEQVVAASKAPADTGLGAPPKALGQLNVDAPVLDAPPAGAQPLDLSTLAGDGTDAGGQPLPADNTGAGTQVASIAPTGDPRADYDQAYRLVTAGRYDVAETAFRQFIQAYPNDALAPDAQYWLGESLYAHGNYAGAAEEFKTGYQKYPKSRRAPDSLLKLGLSMAGLDYREEACKMYALALKQYPQMSNGLKARVKAEQASASC